MRLLLFFSLFLVACQSYKRLHKEAVLVDTHNDVLSTATMKGLNIENNLNKVSVFIDSKAGGDERLRLRYGFMVEDPEYLEKPSSFTMLWDHRPDLKPAQKSEVCEPAIARRYLEY